MRMVMTGAVLWVALTGATYTHDCNGDMASIDKALAASTGLTVTQKAEVMARRAYGEEMHLAKKHEKAVTTMAKAKEILGIK